MKYTKEHEWARIEDGCICVGITDYAQHELGDVVFVELPEVGSHVEQDDTFGSVESVKAVSDLFAPVSGTIKAINADLETAPEAVNEDSYGKGWMVGSRIPVGAGETLNQDLLIVQPDGTKVTLHISGTADAPSVDRAGVTVEVISRA